MYDEERGRKEREGKGPERDGGGRGKKTCSRDEGILGETSGEIRKGGLKDKR